MKCPNCNEEMKQTKHTVTYTQESYGVTKKDIDPLIYWEYSCPKCSMELYAYEKWGSISKHISKQRSENIAKLRESMAIEKKQKMTPEEIAKIMMWK